MNLILTLETRPQPYEDVAATGWTPPKRWQKAHPRRPNESLQGYARRCHDATASIDPARAIIYGYGALFADGKGDPVKCITDDVDKSGGELNVLEGLNSLLTGRDAAFQFDPGNTLLIGFNFFEYDKRFIRTRSLILGARPKLHEYLSIVDVREHWINEFCVPGVTGTGINEILRAFGAGRTIKSHGLEYRTEKERAGHFAYKAESIAVLARTMGLWHTGDKIRQEEAA